MRSGGRRRAGLALLVAISLGGAATACGSASAPSPPGGVDGLTVPTPDPRPEDFVAVVDNPWLPLLPGTRWRYGDRAGSRAQVTVEVEPGPRVAGVATTTLVRTDRRGRAVRDHYAQDREGNVWWFGRAGEWEAGVDGAAAGLAMPADPRRGDGFRAGPDTVITVEDVDATVETPLTSYDDAVELAVDDDGVVHTEFYVRGVGLVRTGETGLVAYDEPRSEG